MLLVWYPDKINAKERPVIPNCRDISLSQEGLNFILMIEYKGIRGIREAQNGELIPGQWIRQIIARSVYRRESGSESRAIFLLRVHCISTLGNEWQTAKEHRMGCRRNGPHETRRCLRIQTFIKGQNRGRRLMIHLRRKNEKGSAGSIIFPFYLQLLLWRLCSVKLPVVKLLRIRKYKIARYRIGN